MANSPMDGSVPPDAKITSMLQRAVRTIFDSGDLESLTLRRVRADAEQKLGLAPDFLKTDKRWKEKSKTIVNDEVERCDATQVEPTDVVEEPDTKRTEVKAKEVASSSKKRKSQEPDAKQPKKKRQKSDGRSRSDGESSSPLSSALSVDEKDDEDKDSDITKGESSARKGGATTNNGDLDHADESSELSEVLDEMPGPKKKRGRGPSAAREPSSKKKERKKKTGSTAKGESNLSPQEEEIKKLQSQLLKCGIRKVWSRELAKFDSPHAKISHLKQMLQDAGLEGRFSEEKARQIKEKRELEAELEAVQAYSKAWGKAKDDNDDDDDDDDDDGNGNTKDGDHPRRRRVLAKGLQELQALVDDEEDDSD